MVGDSDVSEFSDYFSSDDSAAEEFVVYNVSETAPKYPSEHDKIRLKLYIFQIFTKLYIWPALTRMSKTKRAFEWSANMHFHDTLPHTLDHLIDENIDDDLFKSIHSFVEKDSSLAALFGKPSTATHVHTNNMGGNFIILNNGDILYSCSVKLALNTKLIGKPTNLMTVIEHRDSNTRVPGRMNAILELVSHPKQSVHTRILNNTIIVDNPVDIKVRRKTIGSIYTYMVSVSNTGEAPVKVLDVDMHIPDYRLNHNPEVVVPVETCFNMTQTGSSFPVILEYGERYNFAFTVEKKPVLFNSDVLNDRKMTPNGSCYISTEWTHMETEGSFITRKTLTRPTTFDSRFAFEYTVPKNITKHEIFNINITIKNLAHTKRTIVLKVPEPERMAKSASIPSSASSIDDQTVNTYLGSANESEEADAENIFASLYNDMLNTNSELGLLCTKRTINVGSIDAMEETQVCIPCMGIEKGIYKLESFKIYDTQANVFISKQPLYIFIE